MRPSADYAQGTVYMSESERTHRCVANIFVNNGFVVLY